MNGNSRYFDTGKIGFQSLGRRQPFRVGSREVDHQADHRLAGMVNAADADAPDFDHPGQFARRTHPTFFAVCIQMDTVVTDQDGRRKLPAAAGQDEIEGEAGLARS